MQYCVVPKGGSRFATRGSRIVARRGGLLLRLEHGGLGLERRRHGLELGVLGLRLDRGGLGLDRVRLEFERGGLGHVARYVHLVHGANYSFMIRDRVVRDTT